MMSLYMKDEHYQSSIDENMQGISFQWRFQVQSIQMKFSILCSVVIFVPQPS